MSKNKKSNGKATYFVVTSNLGYPDFSATNCKSLVNGVDLFHVEDLGKVDYTNVKIIKFGGAGNDFNSTRAYVNRLTKYKHNAEPGAGVKMYPIHLYNVDTHEEMYESELHRFIKDNEERVGLRWEKSDTDNKNEWYRVVNAEKLRKWLGTASRCNGILQRDPNVLTDAQEKVLENLRELNGKYNDYFLYASTRFRKSGTCLEHNRRVVNANFMLVVSPISESASSYKNVIKSFAGFEDYEFIESDTYGTDITNLQKDISHKLNIGKTVVFFATWAWFWSGDRSNFLDDIEGIRTTFVVVDEFHNSSDTEKSKKILDNIRTYLKAKTLYMSGTPFNELINNSGLNDIFDTDKLIIYDLGDMLKSNEYSGFRFEHHLMEYDGNADCNFDFEDECTVRKQGDKDNTFKRFVDETKVIDTFKTRKTSLCYMSNVKCVKVAYKYLTKVFKEDDNWKIFSTDKEDTKKIIEKVEVFHRTHPNGHCVIVTCNKFVMGATIKTCDAIHFMKRIGSTENVVQAWGRPLTLTDGKTSAEVYYYDDKSFWNLYLKFDLSHEHLTHKRKNDYYKNGAIVFEHIYRGMNPCEMSDQLVNVYLKKYREFDSKDSAIDNSIATGFDFDEDIDIEETAKKSSSAKVKKDEAFPGENPATPTRDKDAFPREDPDEGGDGDGNETNTKEVSKKEKVIQFIKDNILNYLYFANSLFSQNELKEFKSLSNSTNGNQKDRYVYSLGILFEKPEFDKYINKIRLMKTHVIGEGQWEKMCDSHRNEILTRFKTALTLTEPANYEKTFTLINHKIVTELYEKNQTLLDSLKEI